METQRMILFVSLAFVVLLLWQQWQEDYGPKLPGTVAVEGTASEPGADVPQAGTDIPSEASVAAAPAEMPKTEIKGSQRIRVRTDVLDVELDTYGGDLRRADLITYPIDPAYPDHPFELMTDRNGRLFIAQSGLLSSSGEAPDHHAIFQSAQTDYQLADGDDELKVELVWRAESGVTVSKIYTFTRGSYRIDAQQRVSNQGSEAWTGRPYRQLQRQRQPQDSGMQLIHTYTGGVIYSDAEKYEKIDFDDMAKANLSRQIPGGWVAMIQHYFLGAWVPDPDQTHHYYSKHLPGDRFALGMVSPSVEVAPNSEHTFRSVFYVGPKLQDDLAEIATGLELTVDYGFLTVLAQPLFWLLKKFHALFGNWGWAIIAVTILIKLVFYKLSETSYRSMANMRKITPRMKALKERYGDDKQKFQQAMMDMYKKEKINPLGGCLPILVQIPVFIALYWVLLESVELRQAPFILWITDLSAKDPYFVLPVLMGITMLIQQRLNPAPMDPIQQKVMMVLPIVFTVFFAFFPSGLVLYWVVNNGMSIAQQWVITRRIEQGEQG